MCRTWPQGAHGRLAFSVIGGVGYVLALQVTILSRRPAEVRGHHQAEDSRDPRAGKGGTIEQAQSTVKEVIGELQKDDDPKTRKPMPVVVEGEAPTGVAGLKATLARLAVLAIAGLVIVLVIFMLLERQRLLDRLIRLGGYRRSSLTTKILTEAGERISRYLLMRVDDQRRLRIAIGIGLFLIGVVRAAVRGAAAVLPLRPYVGAWIAASLPVVMSLAVFDGWREPIVVWPCSWGWACHLSPHRAVPARPQRRCVLPLALLTTLAFWTWLWGPVGLVVGTPLTVCLLTLGRHAGRGVRHPVRRRLPSTSAHRRAGDDPVGASVLQIEPRREAGPRTGADLRLPIVRCLSIRLRCPSAHVHITSSERYVL